MSRRFPPGRDRRWLRWWAPLAAYMGLIFWSSSRPIPEILDSAPDVGLHFAAYFLFGILSVRAFGRGLGPRLDRHVLFHGFVFALAYALSDEWHQSFVPQRHASFDDWFADALGAATAVVLLALYSRLRATPRPDGTGGSSRV